MQIDSEKQSAGRACVTTEQFDQDLSEEALQRIAATVTSRLAFEKMASTHTLKTGNLLDRLASLATSNKGSMLIFRPDGAHAIKSKSLWQTLATHKNTLVQDTPEPLANSRLSFEQLEKAVADASGYLCPMKEVRREPSPLISDALSSKKCSEARDRIKKIASLEDQSVISCVTSCMEGFKDALTDFEKKIGETKDGLRELHGENMIPRLGKTTEQARTSESNVEKRQVSVSNFKAEQN
jgi:hypothetical protein